jgi:asparagine synthase (glutamine-hydrolysing)
VLVAAYAQWGQKCVERLRGMFAFAILDRGDGASAPPTLCLARDRLGIKPLYYAIRDGVLVFASEIKGLLASGIVSRRIDRQAVCQYLALGSIPQPRTILADASALMPGHVMNVDLSLEIDVRRYWDIADDAARSYPAAETMTGEEARLALRALLEDAVKCHLLADVPVGAFLSGGIDSTAVVGLMSRATGRAIKTFSVGFVSQSGQPDELEWARMAAHSFGTEHTEVIVTGRDVADRYDALVHAIDQPSLDGANTFLVAQAAGQSVKVALSGLGGDELFAGYAHFRQFAAAARWDPCLGWLGPAVRKRLLGALPARVLPEGHPLALERLDRYARLRNLSDDDPGLSRVSAAFMEGVDGVPVRELYRPWLRPGLDAIAETSYVEVQGYLANTLLRDVDATAMGNSLEVRPVLLDHPVAEFAFALPARLKLGKRENKPALVSAVRDLLPEGIIRRRKMGFELPLTEWLSGPLRERALAAFYSSVAVAIFSPQYLAGAAQQLSVQGRPKLALWANLMLVEWLTAHNLQA